MARKNKVSQEPKKPQLRAGYVLAVDIVQYSLRNTVDQTKIVQQLVHFAKECKAYQRSVQSSSIIPAPSGDGFMIAFLDDMLAPIECAKELQKRVLQSKSFRIRQAIHIGALEEIEKDIADKENIAGEAVNMAARALQGCGPDEIVLTRRAVEFVRESPEVEPFLSKIGTITVKHGEELEIWRLNEHKQEEDSLKPFLKRASRAQDAAVKNGVKAVAPVRVIAHRLRDLQKEALLGLALVPVGFFLHVWIEHTDFGRRLRLFGYEKLYPYLATGSGESPVTLIDIEKRFNQPGAEERTDLHKLRALLDEVASYKPAAIAVDINFGIGEAQNQSNQTEPGVIKDTQDEFVELLDPEGIVVRRAMELTRAGTPVYLAVYHGLALEDKESWLGEGFSDLAVHPMRPTDALHGQVLMSGDLEIFGNRVPSIASRLAEDFRKRHHQPHFEESNWVTRHTEFGHQIQPVSVSAGSNSHAAGEIHGESYLLNPNTLSLIHQTDLEAHPEPPILRGDDLRKRIEGKAIVIGATQESSDFFRNPTTARLEWGPYFHAMAAYTEISAPVYELTLPVRLSLILITALGVLFASQYSIRRVVAHSQPWSLNHATALLTWLTVGIFVVGGFSLAKFGILYTEYFLVAVLVAMHPWFHKNLESVLHRFSSRSSEH